MASRTKQKEQARERRLAEERARLEREQRVRRMRMLGGVLVAAVAVVVVIVVVSISGNSSSTGPAPSSAGAKQESTQVDNLLAGIPQSGETIGSPSAPVTVTEYGDLECPICREFALTGETQLIAHEVRAGKVKLVYKSFATATGGAPNPNIFFTQQASAYAAGLQDKAWYYILLFYHEQGQEDTGYVNQAYLEALAKQVPGLDYAKWLSQYNSSSLQAQVNSEDNFARSSSFGGTPTIIFQGPKGQTQPIDGDLSYSDLQAGIRTVS